MSDKYEREREEEKLEEKIRAMTEEMEVPDRLKPENVEKILGSRRRMAVWKKFGVCAAAAASLCLAAGIGSGIIRNVGKDRNAATVGEKSGQEEIPAAAVQGLAHAEDYSEIYRCIRAASETVGWNGGNSGTAVEDAADFVAQGSNMAAKAEASGGKNTAGTDYSDTNVREADVGEGDVVKTDGKYLYIMGLHKIDVVNIEDQEMKKTAEIPLEEEGSFCELYVEGDLLAAAYTGSSANSAYEDDALPEDGAGTESESKDLAGQNKEVTGVCVYDISDRTRPELTGIFTQSGLYNTMRIKDGYVYLITGFYAGMAADPADQGSYIPQIGQKLAALEDIYLPESGKGQNYTLISTFALKDPETVEDTVAVLGSGGCCYVSENNIYVIENIYDSSGGMTQTLIRRIAFEEGTLLAAAQTKISGTLHDSFSIDEYEGYLRLVTTTEPVCISDEGVQPMAGAGQEQENTEQSEDAKKTTSLYVLDENLKTVGEIHDLAPEESVYSVRFLGDVGYFVTFEEIDPLFSADLSDPENPRIAGQLKIPGFSEYLHPYGENRLLGIGMNVDGEAMTPAGVKLSMFDIGDPSNVKELTTFVIKGTTGTQVYNYKAVFADPDRNLFGFTADAGGNSSYYIFTYAEETGFRQMMSRELQGTDSGDTRGLYAGERFYLVCGNTVESFTLDSFEKVDDMIL